MCCCKRNACGGALVYIIKSYAAASRSGFAMLGNRGPSCFRLGEDLWRIVVVSGIYYKRRMELNEFIYFYKFAGHSINILGMSLVCSYFWRIFKHNKRVVSLRNPSIKIMRSAIGDVANITRLLIKHTSIKLRVSR